MARRPLGRVLVTGAGGFLGGAARATLEAAGVRTVATDVAAAPERSILGCDVTERGEIDAVLRERPVDTILHCGAISGPMVTPDRPEAIWRVNALGTANVLESARLHRVSRIVLCSTTDVYGTARRDLLDETAAPDPETVYGASKAAAEQAVLGYARQHGVDGVVARLSWIYGPGRRTPTELERLVRAAAEGREATVVGRPEDLTHYLHVDDAVRGLLAAASAARPKGRIYNVTAGVGLPLGDVVEALKAASPAFRADFVGTASGSGPAGFDGRRAERDIGFIPEIDLREGLLGWISAPPRPAPRPD